MRAALVAAMERDAAGERGAQQRELAAAAARLIQTRSPSDYLTTHERPSARQVATFGVSSSAQPHRADGQDAPASTTHTSCAYPSPLMPAFRPGLDLARDFYRDVVRPLIDRPHAACLLGEGSDVLGYDQPRSTDHEWGPRLQVFVDGDDVDPVVSAIGRGLPERFGGWPVRFFALESGTVRHHVEVTTLDSWLITQLGANPRTSMSTAAWLAVPQQHLLQVTAGAVFHDGIGDLTRVREALGWYPHDIWLWMLASQWHLIGNTEPLVGRTAEASDHRGARLIATRLVRLLMQLCFLQERRYWPYPKWFGTAFSQLSAAATIGPMLDALLAAGDHLAQEDAMVAVLEAVARRHNELDVTATLDPTCRPFEVGINCAIRPYRVLNTGRFVAACQESITNDSLREMVTVGSIDQLTHTDDALINFTRWPQHLRDVYQQLLNR